MGFLRLSKIAQYLNVKHILILNRYTRDIIITITVMSYILAIEKNYLELGVQKINIYKPRTGRLYASCKDMSKILQVKINEFEHLAAKQEIALDNPPLARLQVGILSLHPDHATLRASNNKYLLPTANLQSGVV